MISKVDKQQPIIFSVLWEWQSSVAESSCNTVRAGSSFNQQREQCRQISRSDSHVQFSVGIHFVQCQSWWVGNRRPWTVLLSHLRWILSQNWILMSCRRTTATVTRSQVTGWNPLEGFTKSSCGKLNLVARSWFPTLERGRGSNWEPRD
jgi:hypothetical protein